MNNQRNCVFDMVCYCHVEFQEKKNLINNQNFLNQLRERGGGVITNYGQDEYLVYSTLSSVDYNCVIMK